MSLTLSHITFRYPGMDSDVLDDVSLEVGRGESVALMGPSGRGKSTLLSVAGLLLKPQRGTVLIDGRPRTVSDAPALLGSTIAWVLQTVSLLPRRTVLDNVALPLLAKGAERAGAYVKGAAKLADVGLEGYGDRQARTLSGGEAQRVGVARALVTNPSILLADEPTANLDQRTARIVGDALFRSAQGTSLLVTTHDEEIAQLADRIVYLGGNGTVPEHAVSRRELS